jgi:hypothetical protein
MDTGILEKLIRNQSVTACVSDVTILPTLRFYFHFFISKVVLSKGLRRNTCVAKQTADLLFPFVVAARNLRAARLGWLRYSGRCESRTPKARNGPVGSTHIDREPWWERPTCCLRGGRSSFIADSKAHSRRWLCADGLVYRAEGNRGSGVWPVGQAWRNQSLEHHSLDQSHVRVVRGGEMLDRALYSIAPAIALHRVDCVVVDLPWGKALDAHAKNRLGMVSV